MNHSLAQADLFPPTPAPTPPMIPGLSYQPDFLDPAAAESLMATIDQQPWRQDLKRRVQHYGYRYDYKARRVAQEDYLGPLPAWLQDYAERIAVEGLMPQKPDQVIVNDYQPGQGIAPHVDCVPCFAATILALSLGSACIMDLTRVGQPEDATSLLLEPRSLLVLSGAARYDWTHGIAARQTDRLNGQIVRRNRRVSLTFRKVNLS